MSDIEIRLEPHDEFNHKPDKASTTMKACISMYLTQKNGRMV